MYLLKPTEGATGVNPDTNHGLQVIMRHQCRFIDRNQYNLGGITMGGERRTYRKSANPLLRSVVNKSILVVPGTAPKSLNAHGSLPSTSAQWALPLQVLKSALAESDTTEKF